MQEKIKKILRIIITVITILWIFGEIVFKDSWEEPRLAVIIGVLIIWGILTYSLREKKQIYEKVCIRKDIKICRHCGNENEEDANFCIQCGRVINEVINYK